MERLNEYLAPADALLEETPDAKGKPYFHPRRKNLGCVTLVVLREAIAPVVFRNAEEEITDIEFDGRVHARAVPNKFKYPERQRGLQVLRFLGAGGRFPQNKTLIPKGEKAGAVYDLNTLVFGDSANHENRVLPVRAAVNYSDGLSILPKHLCVEETFHNRAMEDGTLFDAESKKNSDNLFTRHFLRPGTLMVQAISTRGRVLPPIGFQHLLLSVGLAGSYGGQTAVIGTNIRTWFVGIYADRFEQAVDSPYEMLRHLYGEAKPSPDDGAETTAERLHGLLKNAHALAIPGNEVHGWANKLVEAFDNGGLTDTYRKAAVEIREYFDKWFHG